MTKREVIKAVLERREPQYVPWSCGFTVEDKAKLKAHFGQAELFDNLADACEEYERTTWGGILRPGTGSAMY